MKRIFTYVVITLITLSLYAQVPQKMSYQAVIRNSANQLVTNQAVGMQISILQGSVTGTPVYVETQSPTTNENGLVTVEIGGGTVVTGTFATIDWSAGTYFIKTEIDLNGGANYTITGASQLLSVPYALYAKTSEDIIGIAFSFTGDTMYLGTNKIIVPGISAANQLKDIDGNVYKTVKIGTQVWMAENLKTTKYRNGDLIGTTNPATLEISDESTPKYQWAYDGNESNVATHGRLYTWYAVSDNRSVCPAGWHVSTDADWTTLIDFLTNNGYGYEGSGSDIGKSMAATSGWITITAVGSVGNDQASNNSSGFTALPSGYRYDNGFAGSFNYIGEYGFWWSSTEESPNQGWHRYMSCMDNSLNRANTHKRIGLSVRCLRD